MKIADWEDTIKAERDFWLEWLDRLTDKWRESDTAEFQWTRKGRIVLEILRRQDVSLTDEARILEVGGGMVEVIRYFPKGQLFGADALRDFFEEQRKHLGKAWEKIRHDLAYICDKAEDIPLDSGPFDIVVMLNALDHCEDPEEILRRLAVLMPEGAWLFEATTVWGQDGRHLPSLKRYAKVHPHLYEEDDLNEMIEASGFLLLDDPMGDGSLEEMWTKKWKPVSWPCYLRVWRRAG